jgi:diacylglycerol kinase (ATP)
MKPSEIALIVNQDSSRATSRMRIIHELARKHKLKLKICDGPDLDYTIRETLKNRSIKRLIIGGGDGTVSLAASLIHRQSRRVELAILPVGTANYYAKSLGLVRSLTKNFDIAMGGECENRHLCRVNNRHFLLGLNIGVTSKMFDEVTDEAKQRFGKIAYIRGIVRVLRKVNAPDITVKANGKVQEYTSAELVVLNQYLDDPVPIMPRVRGSEPYFEIIFYGLGNSKLSPLFAVIIYALTLGRNQKYLKRIKTTHAVITTKKSQPVAVDGDSLEKTPITVESLEKPVRFVRSAK